MPRAFLLTHKRYLPQDQHRECSPENSVSTAECGHMSRNSLPSHGRYRVMAYKPQSSLQESQGYRGQETLYDEEGTNSEGNEDVTSQSSASTQDCTDEFYNLTKLAEVSLAAAAGHLFRREYCSGTWPDQEYPEDLSRDSATPSPSATEVYTCPECGKRYSTSSNLARHRQTHRSLADKKARRCPHCDKIYVSMPAFSMHMRTHNQGCKCTYCGKCFSRPWLLQGHIRTHTGEKPFKCTICPKAFADKSNLRAHVQTHSNMKPHVCGRCGKAFALKSYLYKHEESSCMKLPVKHLATSPVAPPVLSIPTPVISRAVRASL